MRIGQNPAKFIDQVAQPQKVTVALVVYLPFLEGYYAEGLDILKVCLESIWQNTNQPYDLLVFDNASCAEVRGYLTEQQRQGRIQFLVLSDKNIGKGGAWNFIFQAAPGEFIAYADSDVYFYPGWLSAQLALFEIFPRLGMVTGAPLRVPEEFSTSTVAWAQDQPGVELQRGMLISWEDYWKHAHSLGIETEDEGRKLYQANQDVCLVHQGVRYFVGAAHYQFVARKQVIQELLPLPSDRPMGQMRLLDIAINQRGYLRLSTPDWWVEHLGNTLAAQNPAGKVPLKQPAQNMSGIAHWKPVRKALMTIYKKLFEILYRP
jgi:glycosyltransferase involved in cell wall biosynthesis